MSSLRDALEAALVENPDDLAAHMAYADHLQELGDPRGEFVQVQLALEDANLDPGRWVELRQREAALLAQHARRWLGELGRLLVGDWSGPDKPYHFAFRRGWLDLVRVLPAPEVIFPTLATAPEARLLRRLEVVYDMRYHPFDFHEVLSPLNEALTEEEQVDLNSLDVFSVEELLPSVLASPYLTNLCAFKLGFSDRRGQLVHSTQVDPFGACTVAQVIRLLEKNPRLEELALNAEVADIRALFGHPRLEQLRTLQYYYGTNYNYYGNNRRDEAEVYPLDVLANNPAARGLTALRLHPGRSTELTLTHLAAVLQSPHLAGLTHLQFHMTQFGDEGIRPILASGVLRRLRHLDLGYGDMTDAGARLLAEAPDLRRLDALDVSRNALTEEGVAVLRATGVRIVADDQHAAAEGNHLFEVDCE